MAPSMQFRMPPAWFFKFPPDFQPAALPPPTDARTFASPFAIRSDIYNGALDYKVPITIGTIYAATVILWNKINRDRGNKPYGFSQTKSFKAFVIAHNVLLAVFSAFTFFGMLRALAHTWPGREHHLLGKFWPGLRTSNGVAGAADALCKMHGPRGFGSYVSFNRDSGLWEAKDSLVKLANTGLPDGTDVGRLWNEGLAFWGWWFYLSKFYEVFDTFIILAKGKRSSTLQTYHHTGAMMCMWAGIRYMSPPIWMFCFLNSGIHTMMYIYYTLSALSIRVPQRIKRSLTTMQIMQFLIGITFAGMHLFVTYRIPMTTTEAVSKTLDSIASSVVSGVSSAAATAASGGIAAWLKQAALRAAGEEGLAENVLSPPVQLPVIGTRSASSAPPTRYLSGWETVPCIDTSGQAFAIWLNLLYLAPLTGLFVRFFIRSYTRRGAASRNQPQKGKLVKSIKDAAHGTNREFDSLGKTAENGVDGLAKHMNGNGNGQLTNGKSHASSNGSSTPRSRKVSDTIGSTLQIFEKADETAATVDTPPSVKSARGSLRKRPSDGHNKLRKMFEDGSVWSRRSESPSQDRVRKASDADSVVEKLEGQADAAVKRVKDVFSASQESLVSADSSILEEDEVVSPTTVAPETQPEPKSTELEQSWADVAKDTYQHKEQQERQARQEATAATSGDQSPAEEQQPQEEERSSTPTSRSLSPQKSKLPRPLSQVRRSRSPVKKTPAESKKKSSSIPRPSITNGTKQQSSSSSITSATSNGKDEKSASSTSLSPSTSSTTTTEAGEKQKKNRTASRGALARSSSSSSLSSALKPTVHEDDEEQARQGSSKTKEKAEAREEDQEKETSTNTNHQQDTSPSPSAEPNFEVESLPADGTGNSSERLRFRHVDDGSGEVDGGEAKRKDDVSFAEAVKEGDAAGGSGNGEEEGDISID